MILEFSRSDLFLMCNLKHGGGRRLLAAILGLGVFAAGPLLAAPASPIPGSQTAPSNYLWNSTDQYPLLAIRSITVNGRTLPLTANQSLRLPAHPDITSFNFGPNELASNSPLRFRCQLDGYEQEWHERPEVMRMIIRFIDASERNIAEKSFDVYGESPGWNGSFSDSPWVRRREVIPVPADAVRFWVVISSAGPPDSVGVFAVRNLVVFTSESDTNGIRMIPPVTPDATKAEVEAAKVSPVGWERGGLRPTDGRLLRYGPDSEVALAILDDNPQGHADWSTTWTRGPKLTDNPQGHPDWSTALTRGPKVTPGEKLTIKWEEAYSIGAANYGNADYVQLPAGLYRFRMEALDLMGVPTGRGVSRLVTVPVAFWKTIWFWMTAGLALFGLAVGGWRLVESRKMKRQVQLIERQRVLEQERTRIA